MPELPEVETVVSDLRPELIGRTITACEVTMPSIVRHPDAAGLKAGVTGRRLETASRRGKYILFGLDGGDALVVHLGMTGHLQLFDPAGARAPHVHALFDLDDGRQLRYRDPRRFGRLLYGRPEHLVEHRALPRLGPEPIDPAFTAADLRRRLAGRRAPVKALLLDQAVVAGVGNIYADEACFAAGVRPDRPGASLSRPAAERLHAALRDSLLVAIANRGSSVNTYRDGWGNRGTQQERLLVYGRAGEPCARCGRPLASRRLAGRTTVFCTRCQR